jgi:hydroxymethylpyrimidine/phosphomethylpyrimidine kinase
MQTVLTIAGFDPSSGAGITADLMVFAAHGLFGTSAITGLTVQSTSGVRAVKPVDAETLRATLDFLHADLPPTGIKIGMLARAPLVEAAAAYLETVRRLSPGIPVVLDPVIRSSSGRELWDPAGVMVLRERLLPLVTWVTPNVDELSLLANLPVDSGHDLEAAVRSLQQVFPELGVIATGGHLDPPYDLAASRTGQMEWLAGERVGGRSTHGTGCAFSSALLSRLVLGDDPIDAARSAKQYVAEAIRRASPLGYGHGPMNHLWPLR